MKSKLWGVALIGLAVGMSFFNSPPALAQSSAVTITWHGHANFTIACAPKLRVVIDPYTPGRSVVAVYKTPQLEGEAVLVTHEHLDHNNVEAVGSKPTVIRGTGFKGAGTVTFQGIPSYHDSKQGQERGLNTIFRWECGGISFAHLGDLGQKELTGEQLTKIGKVEVLFIPVGGTFTIGPQEATGIVEQIKPLIVVPMHYKPKGVTAENPLVGVEQFLKDKKNIKYLSSNTFTISKDNLPQEREIWVPEVKGLLK